MQALNNSQGETIDASYHAAAKDDCLVILGHGVTANKDRPLMVAIAEAIAHHGYPALRISFSGNGCSEGLFTESTITKEIADLTAVIDQLGNGKKIAYIGHSMGGAVGALTAARDERIQVLVSLAGMVHTKAFCEREFGSITPDEGLMWDEECFPLSRKYVDDLNLIDSTLNAAKEVRKPWLLIHGTDDDIVPLTDSQDLLDSLRGHKKLVALNGANHALESYHDDACLEIISWLQQHLR